jgi:glycerol dehydrogenase
MSLKIFIAPLRYIQGPHALYHLGDQLKIIGVKKPLVLISRSAKKAIGSIMEESITKAGLNYGLTDFNGECSWDEINRVKVVCQEGSYDAIINCGGGKTIDTGRAAACSSATNFGKIPPELIPGFGASVACINIPTVAATDASTSAVSLVYSKDGTVEAGLSFPKNPDMVLVDTFVIAQSPVRLLVSGMGDALATYFEAHISQVTGTPSAQTGALSTLTAQAIGKLCLDILLTNGVQAIAEAHAHTPGPALEAVVEANVLLSGLGFESGGLSAAHAIGEAFHHIRNQFDKHLYHGELVAFGTCVQLVLEQKNSNYLKKIFNFCKSVGLPITLDDMTLGKARDEDLMKVADAASRHIIIRSMPEGRDMPDQEGRYYNHLDIFNAIKTTDAIARILI